MPQTLVDYSDSDDDRPVERKRLPALDLSTDTYKDEWLSYVCVQALKKLLALVSKAGSKMCSFAMVEDYNTLHISLTRPLVLRRSEQRLLTAQVEGVVQTSHASRFSIAFSQFACFPSDTSERVFIALECNTGWHQLHQLARALDERVHALFGAPLYFTEARFHASVGYFEDIQLPRAKLVEMGHIFVAELNAAYGDMLRSVPPVNTTTIFTQFRYHTDAVHLL